MMHLAWRGGTSAFTLTHCYSRELLTGLKVSWCPCFFIGSCPNLLGDCYNVKVKGTSSPDDPKLNFYWEHRNTQYGKTYWAKGSKHLLVAKNQNWKCPVCGEHLFNGEELHTHHIIQVKDGGGGTDEVNNLVHLHKACHKHIHTGKRSMLEA